MFTDQPQSKKWSKSPLPNLQKAIDFIAVFFFFLSFFLFVILMCEFASDKMNSRLISLQKWSMVCLSVCSQWTMFMKILVMLIIILIVVVINTVWQKLQVPSHWLLFWNYRHNQYVLEVLFSVLDHYIYTRRQGFLFFMCRMNVTHSQISNGRLPDFVITYRQMKACVWMKAS